MPFYCISNLVFSNENKFYSLEEFCYLYLINEIKCEYIYMSNAIQYSFEKFYKMTILIRDCSALQNASELETLYEEEFSNNSTAFHSNKRKFYDEFLKMIENNYDKYFKFCSKIDYFIKFLFNSKYIKIENFAAFIYLIEKKFIIESGKNFGFDYLLYQKFDDEKDFHLHAPYAVSLLDSDSKLAYCEALGKLRIVKNYGKVNIIFETILIIIILF